MKQSSNQSIDGPPQIVPKGYWTFWFILSLLGGMGGAVTALLERNVILGVISLAWGVAWSIVYWRIKRGKSSATP
jgi:hypothetical protein